MTSPAQDHSMFDVDPLHQVGALRNQRNLALDDAAMWRAAATQERIEKLALTERIATLESLVEAFKPRDTEEPRPDEEGKADPAA